jgi:hypothetical protein
MWARAWRAESWSLCHLLTLALWPSLPPLSATPACTAQQVRGACVWAAGVALLGFQQFHLGYAWDTLWAWHLLEWFSGQDSKSVCWFCSDSCPACCCALVLQAVACLLAAALVSALQCATAALTLSWRALATTAAST